ncbi:hypothetical protein N9L92_03445 [Saprospiraceae bacterium]|nr:hypothetical protein [Saprospiraceae bacterium]
MSQEDESYTTNILMYRIRFKELDTIMYERKIPLKTNQIRQYKGEKQKWEADP